MRDRTNISDALENHEENKNKDLSSTICEFVSLECTPQVRYIWSQETMAADTRSVLYYITTLDQKWINMYNSLLKSSLGSLLKFSSRF